MPGIQNLYLVIGYNITGNNLLRPFHIQKQGSLLARMHLKKNFFEIQNYVGYVLGNLGYSTEFVIRAIDFYRNYCCPLKTG
jgi:hypothetical protein